MAVLASACVVLGLIPGLVLPTLMRLAPGARTQPVSRGTSASRCRAPAPTRRSRVALALVLLTAGLTWAARLTPQRAGTVVGMRAAAGTRTQLDLDRLHQAAAARARQRAPSPADDRGARGRRDGAGDHLLRPRPLACRHQALRADDPRRAARGAVARRLQTGNVRTYAAYLLGLVIGLLLLARTGVL